MRGGQLEGKRSRAWGTSEDRAQGPAILSGLELLRASLFRLYGGLRRKDGKMHSSGATERKIDGKALLKHSATRRSGSQGSHCDLADLPALRIQHMPAQGQPETFKAYRGKNVHRKDPLQKRVYGLAARLELHG